MGRSSDTMLEGCQNRCGRYRGRAMPVERVGENTVVRAIDIEMVKRLRFPTMNPIAVASGNFCTISALARSPNRA